MTSFLRIFQDSASNFQKKETEANLEDLRKTTRRCQDSFKQKLQLTEKVLTGVHRRRSDGNDEQLAIQPVNTLDGGVGDTACGTLRKMVENKKSVP